MQLLFDLLPVIAFFVAYKLAGIYVATAVLIVGVLVQTRDQLVPAQESEPDAAHLGVLGAGVRRADAGSARRRPSSSGSRRSSTWLFAGAFLASQFMKGPTLVGTHDG